MPNCCPTCVEEMYGSGIDPTTLVSGTLSVDYRDETAIPCSLANTTSFFYTGVWVLPQPADYDLYRRKWNYVKNMYNAGYSIDSSGNKEDVRDDYFTVGPCSPSDTPNAAYWLDYNKYQREFYEYLFEWTDYAQNRGIRVAIFEKWLQWRFEIGSSTSLYGNLPHHKRNNHDGHCWMPCPYSTDSTDERSDAMWAVSGHPTLTKNDHGNNYMQTDSNGTVWGWRCTYSGCPYEAVYNKPYFYV